MSCVVDPARREKDDVGTTSDPLGVRGRVLLRLSIRWSICSGLKPAVGLNAVGEHAGESLAKGLGLLGDFGGMGIDCCCCCGKEKLLVCTFSGDAGRDDFALYVVEGRGRFCISSSEGGACEKRIPIWTVADDAVDAFRRCAPPNTDAGGCNCVISYTDTGSCCLACPTIKCPGLAGSCALGNIEYDCFRPGPRDVDLDVVSTWTSTGFISTALDFRGLYIVGERTTAGPLTDSKL